MKVLHLTLKKRWFDMVQSGEKKEEYRELKRYWAVRFADGVQPYISELLPRGYGYKVDWKEFDAIVFKNGYSKTSPAITVEFLGFEIGRGKKKWGGGNECFILKLGKIL